MAGADTEQTRTQSWLEAAEQLEKLRTLRRPEVSPDLDPSAYSGTVATWARHWAAERPDTVAVHFYGRDVTFAELDELTDRAAGWLQAQGVKAGDRVGIYLANCPQFLIVFTAVMRLGAVHVPINPMFKAAELEYELKDAQPTVLLAQTELHPIVQAAAENLGWELKVAYTHLGDMLTSPPAPAAPFELPAPEVRTDWPQISGHARTTDLPEVDPKTLAALNYTGGTTGLPKGCEHTHEHMVYTAVSSLAAKGQTPGSRPEVMLCFLPIFWIAGEDAGIINPLVNGSTVVLLTRYHPGVAAELLVSRQVTSFVAPADAYVDLLSQPGFTDHSYALTESLAVSFVKKLDSQLRRQWLDATGSPLREAAYGMTETHTMDTSTYGLDVDDQDLAGEPIYTGYPVPGTRIICVDEDLKPVEPGTAGQILVNSPSVLTRYYNRPEASAQSLIDGWLLTGDTGRFDDKGALTYLARTKEMIKVNGMSVFPAELESIIKTHPAVAQVAVGPREDAERGQVPVAFITLTEHAGDSVAAGAQAGAQAGEEIATWLKETIASYKQPEIVIVDAMPMTATGKIRKVELLKTLTS